MTIQQIKEELLLKNAELTCTCATTLEENDEENVVIKCEKCTQLDYINSLCTCGKCKECVQMVIDRLYQEPCTCTYKTVVEQLPNEEGVLQPTEKQVINVQCERCKEIETLKTKLEWYDMFEKAYIPKELWEKCSIVDGIIVQQSEEAVEKSEVELLRERLEMAENALLDIMLQNINV